jgi:hypothetical protein
MSSKSKNLRAFVSSCETKTEVATPALVPKLRFPEFREILTRRHEATKKEGGMQ